MCVTKGCSFGQKTRRTSSIVFEVEILGRHSLIQRSPGYVTADQNTSWHTTLSTPNGTIISHVPELSQNQAFAPEPSILGAYRFGGQYTWEKAVLDIIVPGERTVASRRSSKINSPTPVFADGLVVVA